MLVATGAHAHGEADDVLPADPGVRLSAAVAVSSLHASDVLPSARLRGFLLRGDSGVERRGATLEHATLGADWRIDNIWGASLSVGKHGTDPEHVEAAWLQWRHDVDSPVADRASWWLLTAGRQNPALGAVMGQAGHLDRFALMPLAKQMAVQEDWIDDGVQLGWRMDAPAGRFSVDAGLWRGRVFPGGSGGPLVPSIHLGWGQGPWQLDGWAARLKPEGRGSTTSSNAGHTHTLPVCDGALKDVACFSGRSTLAGASAVWSGARSALSLPVTLTAAGWLRDESGQLESANSLASYSAQNRGIWLEAMWAFRPQWEAGVRLERAWTAQSLSGAGTTLLAAETGLSAYQPATRQMAVLSWSPRPQVTVSMEAGRERAAAPSGSGTSAVSVALLRVVAHTDWLSGAH
jgi:hypothetical protein